MNRDGISMGINLCHAGLRSRMYRRRVRSSQNVDVRRIRDVLGFTPVRKLDYHAQNIGNVGECVIKHKAVLCCS